MNLSKTIKQCSLKTLNNLCRMENERDQLKPNLGKLIFPKDRQPKKINKNLLRISEQEARICFIHEIESLPNDDLYYSIETPTIEKYNFTNKKSNPQSGSLDMCLFRADSNKFAQRILNIEFKAHNMDKYENDFEKLFREPSDGLFFHFLGSVGNGTLNSDNCRKGVLIKYKEAFTKKKGLLKGNSNKKVHFIIVSTSPKFLLYKSLSFPDLYSNDDIFKIDYEITKGKLVFKNLYKWQRLI